MVEQITRWLVEFDLLGQTRAEGLVVQLIIRSSIVALIIVLSLAAHFIAKGLIVRLVRHVIERTETERDDIFLRRKVFTKLSHLAPALVIYGMAPQALAGFEAWIGFVQGVALLYMLVVGVLVVDSLMNAGLDVYQTYEVSKSVPIKGFVQVGKLVLYFLAVIFGISIVLEKSPLYFLSGLGALTAILMLIFKDSILGFVAGIQLTANRMISRGDWIEMPRYGADGDVIDIALTTVKVQNWDKTVTTIPTYALISDSFKNWRGMSESDGRRIKRSIAIDMNSVKFCDEEMIERFSRIEFIAEYVEAKRREIEAHNNGLEVDLSSLVNGRRLTNLGTFRAYVEAYLRQHEQINKGMTFLVRQLAPSERGIPIEIYVFSAEKRWVNYEAIQADIFDHLLAILPEFDLRAYQLPAGGDFRRLGAVADGA